MTTKQTTQNLVSWNESNRMGVADFDGENQRLARLINRLHKTMLAGHGEEILPQVLYHLGNNLSRHFAHEEAVLAGHAYAGLDEQRYQHRQFRMQVEVWEQNYREGKTVATADILIFLKEWWNEHVLGTDLECVPFLREQRIANKIWGGSRN